MDCPHCGKRMSVLQQSCPHCGASATPLLDGRSGLEQVPTGARVSSHQGGAGWVFSALPKPDSRPFLSPEEVTLEAQAGEILQIGQFVFHAPHIQNNPMYRQRLSGCSLLFVAENQEVNAFATEQDLPGVELSPPFIVLLGGMGRATRLAALALGARRFFNSPQSRQVLADTVRGIGAKMLEGGGMFSMEAAGEVIEQAELLGMLGDTEVVRLGRSYWAALNMNIIGHEAGHIALGHTLARAANLEVSRNQEREADSFAASLISTSPFSDYLVGGSIFFWVILAWVDAAVGGEGETTHPHSRDRLMDFIRANRAQAEAIGLSEREVATFLPPGDFIE